MNKKRYYFPECNNQKLTKKSNDKLKSITHSPPPNSKKSTP